jgi:hypothetical protein
MAGYTTDADVMMQAATRLDAIADIVDPLAARFEQDSSIPKEAYGGQSMPPPIPPVWNFSGRLADMIEGPYDAVRAQMAATVGQTAAVLRAYADNLVEAAWHYQRMEALAIDSLPREGTAEPWPTSRSSRPRTRP